MTEPKLILHLPGVPTEDIARGIAAARAVFDSAGVSALAAAAAALRRDRGEPDASADDWEREELRLRHAPDEPSMLPVLYAAATEGRLAYLWDEAEDAALSACGGDRTAVLERTCLQVTFETDLTIQVKGATGEQLARGLTAARRVFVDHGTTAWEVAGAVSTRDGAYRELTDRQAAIAHLWYEAERAAREACCQGWSTWPDTADLELVYDRDLQAQWTRMLAGRYE
jgi:hypothetical protein